jgi:hypothetical protein
MTRLCLILAGYLLIAVPAITQTTLTLQPNAITGKDAEIWDLDPDLNLGAAEFIRGNAWTFQTQAGRVRGLIEFDLTQIPVGSTIHSASLSLFAPHAPTSQFNSGENEAYIRRINSYWHEMEVSWSNQPSTSTLHQVTLPRSNDEYQDYTGIDVTALVQDMMADPANSFGFMLVLQSEDPFRRIAFASSDYTDAARHPKLVIEYTPPSCITRVFQPGPEGKDVEVYSLQPSSNIDDEIIRANAWTFQNQLGIERTLIGFDLTVLPVDATVEHAYLTLYPPPSPSSQFNSGANVALLQRIVSPWDEGTVTWNTQPSVTSQHEVILPASSLEYQEYRYLEVTDMVRDMIQDSDDQKGFLLRLRDEEEFRRLTFASSDHPDPARRPRLEICYHSSVSTTDQSVHHEPILFPNPATDQVEVRSVEGFNSFDLHIINHLGQVYSQQKVYPGSRISLKALPPSVYIIILHEEKMGRQFISRVVKQ